MARKVRKKSGCCNFSKDIERQVEAFGKKMETLGKDSGRKDELFLRFGISGPIIKTIISTVFLAIGGWVLELLNGVLGSVFIAALSYFVFAYLHWFFLAILVSSYNRYFSKIYSSYWVIYPFGKAVSMTIGLWILIGLLAVVNTVPMNALLNTITTMLYENVTLIFFVLLIGGYVLTLIGRKCCTSRKRR